MGLKMKNINAFAHADEHLTQKTVSGAILTIVGVSIILVLFAYEFKFYLSTNVVHQMSVDTTRGQNLPIHINITFPSLPCQILSVDAIDMSGKHEVDLDTNIWKLRLHKDGHILGSEYLSDLVEKEHAHDNLTGIFHSHEELRSAVKVVNEINKALQDGEGCRVFGVLDVERVAGNFHISMHGMSLQVARQIFHSVKEVNVSHIINDLSFGPKYPGIHNPLDRTVRILRDTAGTFKYFIKIVPTEYRYLNGGKLPTNQFSVGEYYLAARDDDISWPAVYFLYDLSPITVLIKEERRSFGHLLTRFCAIVGGTFSLTGMLDRWIYRLVESITRAKGVLI
ncbi:probable endoplasmic reticulum-Golgi intermediate compartment protein 3 isoform X2 [Selaginella moellendorffii]|uniref:probable endoplasmic reticulum-Golgi intermediate compartment protein 3 isoform X2 n=1 Tax=Selaginella moellendorffii TaxID=88036 RepID=UPI000D1CEA52|nr:probable endoplasmic reticulum-Golgi intermediate compartment protein 3 [Selaginella moellendorffii]XP_024523539.1 probable endoplasmic reticulum-Golgi intermediate compartment protein 3 isoform X2 [Selaginella moellendorffii]|eukprot:XP_024522703.1 probable endoplasmic reticulum-Golgi intermediate compartment protein 3 [Selaginella moellendorffii]